MTRQNCVAGRQRLFLFSALFFLWLSSLAAFSAQAQSAGPGINLVRWDTAGTLVMKMTNGVVINSATLPSKNLTFMSDTTLQNWRSVNFTFDNVPVNVEGQAPYVMCGDWNPCPQVPGALGQHTVKMDSTDANGVTTTTTITYTVAAATNPPPTVSLTANPTSVLSGAASTLSWSSTNATSCSASGGWSGTKATSGSQSTGPLSTSSSYTLTCTGAGGSASASASVAVTTSAGPGINLVRWDTAGTLVMKMTNGVVINSATL